MQLLEQIENPLPNPSNIQQVELNLDKIAGNIADSQLREFIAEIMSDKRAKEVLEAVFGNSPYLSRIFVNELEFVKEIFQNGFDETYDNLIIDIIGTCKKSPSTAHIMTYLRQLKLKASLLIAIADIIGAWDLDQVTGALSDFAEASLRGSCGFLLLKAHEAKELEISNLNNPQENSGLIILAMGKLGARELNYSSDIDIISFFDDEKVNYIGKKNPARFFIKFTQDLTRILNERTKDGYVFRVDLRLRPDPGANPCAMSLRSAELYYENFGQNWERAAMIKARPVAGDAESGDKFMRFIATYVWRRALDFESIQDIHSIKRQIDTKQGLLPKNLLGYNIKLGRGGIREIEFFIQTQQLIWGGRRPTLRNSKTCEALHALVISGELEEKTCSELIAAYVFYRKIEHRLQMINDQQTHVLPNNMEDMQNIATFLGYNKPADFIADLMAIINIVKGHYANLFEEEESLASDLPDGGNLVFTGVENDPETLITLNKIGFTKADKISNLIRAWHHGRYRATRAKRARELITKLTPVMLDSFSKTAYPDIAFLRFDDFLKKLPAGIQIFSLFFSNPKILNLIAEIMGAYPFIAKILGRKPALLDYVLAPEFYASMPDGFALKSELERNVNLANDMQDILEAIRIWTHDRQFRVGIQLIKNSISHEEASKHLTDIAEVALNVMLKHVMQEFETKHGRISNSNFAIIAFGKLGGKALTYDSDLDLVFVYDVPDNQLPSDGQKPLLPSEYFARLSRRFISSITSLTKEGQLYDIDMRLRPSGNDGPVAASISAFEKYYEKDAWDWEFMALTRARVIAAPDEFFNFVKLTINNILQKEHNQSDLCENILKMHERSFKKHRAKTPFDIKYSKGGLLDLEYITQFILLKHAHQNPEIISGNTKKALQKIKLAQLYSDEDIDILIAANDLYVTLLGNLRLIGGLNNVIGFNEGIKKTILSNVSEKNFAILQKKLEKIQKNVQKIFHRIIS